MRKTPLALAASLVALLPLAATGPASATINFSQQVRLLNDPSNSVGYSYTYTSFRDGAPNCSSQPGATEPCGGYSTGSGRLTVIPRTYRLVESNKTNDYYLVDLTIDVSNVKGSKDYGYIDADVKSESTVKSASWSDGKSSVSGCKSFPIDIGANWGPLSAGTTVGSFSLNCYNSSITRTAHATSQSYHVTNINGVKSVTFQRFVVVPAGARPTFRYYVRYPTDKCGKRQVSNGSTTVTSTYCTNTSVEVTRQIGTNG